MLQSNPWQALSLGIALLALMTALTGCLAGETCTGAGCDDGNNGFVNNGPNNNVSGCAENDDCPIGFVCGNDNTCERAGGCIDDNGCPVGQQCVEGGCYLIDPPEPDVPDRPDIPSTPDIMEEEVFEGCQGCVRQTDEGELCLPGTFDEACGRAGAVCETCGEGEGCDEGTCVDLPGCDPDNCDGCCDENDQCRTGTSLSACGNSGFECQRCTNGSTCEEGQCIIPCGPESCGGCCDNGICTEFANTNVACGRNGESCQQCGDNQQCDEGRCIDLTCADTCDGCCSDSTCLSGTSSTDCGFNGSACVDCGPGRLCNDGSCVLDPRSRWNLVIIEAQLSETNPNGDSWDAFGGQPDPYLMAEATNFVEEFEGRTTTLDTQTNPFWLENVLTNVPADALTNNLTLTVFDDDAFPFDDTIMAVCNTRIDEELFTGERLPVTCRAGQDTTEATISFRIDRF